MKDETRKPKQDAEKHYLRSAAAGRIEDKGERTKKMREAGGGPFRPCHQRVWEGGISPSREDEKREDLETLVEVSRLFFRFWEDNKVVDSLNCPRLAVARQVETEPKR